MTQDRIELEFFQDLNIAGPAPVLDAVKQAILRRTVDGWTPVPEHKIKRHAPEDDVIAFERAADDLAPAAGLYMRRRNGEYEVTNIVPMANGELGRTRYNAILQDFVARIATPALAGMDAKLTLTEPTHSLEQSFGERAAKALRFFSSAANMSTGSSHPNDRQRWYEFICLVKDQDVDGGSLGRWLIKLGWPEDSAHRLVSEFEFGHGLLQYDQER